MQLLLNCMPCSDVLLANCSDKTKYQTFYNGFRNESRVSSKIKHSKSEAVLLSSCRNLQNSIDHFPCVTFYPHNLVSAESCRRDTQ